MSRVKKLLRFVRTLDWMERRSFVARLMVTNPDLTHLIIEQLGPDELLWGKNSPVTIKGIIALPDGPRGRKRSRQLILERYGVRKRR